MYLILPHTVRDQHLEVGVLLTTTTAPLCIVEGCGLRQANNRLMSALGHNHNGKPNVKHTPRALRRQKVAGYQPQDHGLCRLQEAEDQVPHAGWPSTLLTLQEKRTLLYGQQELADAP